MEATIKVCNQSIKITPLQTTVLLTIKPTKNE
jgi:hypothetical protein